MVYFDNKVFVSVPISSSTYRTWVYFPATGGFVVMSGIHPRCWSKYVVSGEERVCYGSVGSGRLFRGWYGYVDEKIKQTDL